MLLMSTGTMIILILELKEGWYVMSLLFFVFISILYPISTNNVLLVEFINLEEYVSIKEKYQFLIPLLPASFLNLPKPPPTQVAHIQLFQDILFVDR